MDQVDGNPSENQLAHGVIDAALATAVEASGYPLQVLVSAALRARGLCVAEEWAFEDRDKGSLRALDLHASLRLFDWKREGQRRVRPALDLLIECKRSEMPYVFFQTDSRPSGVRATRIVGLQRDDVVVQTDDDASRWHFSVIQALGLAEHPFIGDPPVVCLTFSKAARRGGGELMLSGTDPYQSLVLPLTKALDSYEARVAPVATARYFDAALPIGLAIIDGPMVAVEVAESGPTYRLAPWVRVYRNDVDPDAGHKFDREKLHALDVVHSAWLDNYLEDHLLPFAHEFGRRALMHDEVVATGRAYAEGFNRDSHSGLPARLRPLTVPRRAKRPMQITRHIRARVRDALRGDTTKDESRRLSL